jgi:hypothetical protein
LLVKGEYLELTKLFSEESSNKNTTKMPPRGKIMAMITILLGFVAGGLSIYVLCTCEFYQVSWKNANNKQRTASPGLFLCKYYDGPRGTFNGPTNGFDMFATVAGFAGAIFGLIATSIVFSSYWKCFCKIKNTAVCSCIFMLATVCQGLTLLVLVSEACNVEQNGECKLLTNAWISVGAAATWFIASCFAREIASGGQQLPK